MTTTIRAVKKDDVAALKEVITSTDLFPAELLEEMMAEYWQQDTPTDIWLTQVHDNRPIAVVYCAPERMTEGTYNLYLIAIHKTEQGKGRGTEIMAYLENLLREKGQRVLLVETSGLPEFEQTRKFYDKCSYTREAVIRDFYQDGEDKVVFWKKL